LARLWVGRNVTERAAAWNAENWRDP
jgi:hypothetical protein